MTSFNKRVIMRIAVLADTHIPRSAQDLPLQLYEEIKGVDMIIHAGDITEQWVIDKLKKIAAVKAVYGNMDSNQVQRSLPEKEIIDINGVRIGVTHGKGAPDRLIEYTQGLFKGDGVNAIIFGHSHSSVNKVKDGIVFFNPGSPTDKIFASDNSFGILEINNNSIIGTIKRI